MNEDKSHYLSSNDICTPMNCVREMVDKVPEDFWKQDNIKILDCCCGNGNFHAYISTKTSLDNLYFNEINEVRINNLYKYFGSNINLTKEDFLKFPDEEVYDMIVANPPFAKFTASGSRSAKNHSLSRDFIAKAIKLVKPNGYLLFIVPDNWMSYADRNELPEKLSYYQFLYIDIHGCKKYFPKVGSTFTYFLWQKKENTDEFIVKNSYHIEDTQKVRIDKGIKFVPLYCSNTVLNILKKTIEDESIQKYKIETSSNLHQYTKSTLMRKEKDDVYKYKLWHTPNQVYYSSQPHIYQEGWKVFVSLTTQYETFIDNCGMTQSIAFIRCGSKTEADRINRELNAPIYKFINNITRYGNFGNNRVLGRLPLLEKIDLTQDEMSVIEMFNSAYYSSNKNKSVKKKARNIVLIDSISQLEDEVDYDTYDYRNYFVEFCTLVPNQKEEKLDIKDLCEQYKNKTGFIYIFVIENKIFKIGQSTTTIKERINSYNCGKTEYRTKGTNSTTNYFVLQSLLKIGKEVKVYAYFPPLAKYELFKEDIVSTEAPSKYAERVILSDFEKTYFKKPIGCTQH